MTNQEFGRLVGCHHSMASRLRSGKRLPSVSLLNRISTKLGVPVETLTRAHSRGPESFGRALRKAEKEYEKRRAA